MGVLRGMAGTAAVAGTATAVSNRVSRRQAERTADLQRLATLCDRGLLSDEEFSAAKGRLLGG
jgi:hypothetical protein